MAELSMVLKTLQSLVPELPKLEPGDSATRARRFQQWLLRVGQAIQPAGVHVITWWNWCVQSAEEAHRRRCTKGNMCFPLNLFLIGMRQSSVG